MITYGYSPFEKAKGLPGNVSVLGGTSMTVRVNV